MRDAVETYLKRYGPSLSSDVSAYVAQIHGINATAARQRVWRSPYPRALRGLTFPRRVRFLYLQEQFGSSQYWGNLSAALVRTKSAHGYALAALQQRQGIVPINQFAIVCGAPVRQTKHLSPEIILARLEGAGLVRRVTLSGVGECIALVQEDGYYEPFADRLRAQAVTEGILLLAIKDWLRKLNAASYNAIKVRGDDPAPQVGTLFWDLSGPSYLYPLTRSDKAGIKNGFVACDVHLGDPISAMGVEPFIRKCTTLRGLRKVGACLQIMVADSYDATAFQRLRAIGVMPATPASLFGEEVAAGLRELTSVLENAAHSVIDPDRFEQMFHVLGKIPGATNQLRGTLFEYLAAELARQTLGSDIRMNQIVKITDGRKAEVDVIAVRPHQGITLIECKGWSPRATLPDDKFKRWLQHNVPVSFAAIKEHPDWRNFTPHFELWTTAGLSDEASDLFERARAQINPDRYTIGLRLNEELQSAFRATRDDSLLTAFEKHYTPYPAEPWF